MQHRLFPIRLIIVAAALALAPGLGLRAETQNGVGGSSADATDGKPDSVAFESLQTVMAHGYTMAGRIRPLLFWFGRDDIGTARIVWRRGADGARGYELLVGTDPARAPRSLNRWGYISEEALGANGSLLAIMTRSDEVSYDEAEAGATSGATLGDFRAIRGNVRDGSVMSQVARIRTPAALTIHDLAAALDRARSDTAVSARRETRTPKDARPGFLVAVAELIDRAVEGSRARKPPDGLKGARVQYVFGQAAYELTLRDVDAGVLRLDGRPLPVVRSSFEIRTLATNAKTPFEVTCGTEGQLAFVPVAIEWQPRWWLKVELRLKS